MAVHRTRRWAVRTALGSAAAGLLVLGGPVADAPAACHAFTVTAEPERVVEGGAVEITVSRDAFFGPSQVDVQTVDETARAPGDYATLQTTAEFTLETSLTFTVNTADDSEDEAAETFRVHLSNPDGCSINPNFEIGPDAVVGVDDNDAPAAAPAAGGGATATTARAARSGAARGDTLPSTGAGGLALIAAGAAGAGLAVAIAARSLRRRAG